jgi:hypothetical protein
MTVARHDWVSANKLNPERSGPEIYAPPHRRTPEQLSNADHIPPLHPQTNEAGQADDRAGANLDPLIRRMAGTSIKEIDGVIRELQIVRELLRSEGERINREIADYVGLDRTTISAMRAISGSIRELKLAGRRPHHH